MVDEGYKSMLMVSGASDIVYTSAISGVNANFLRPSIVAAGLDPDDLRSHGALDMASEARAWKNVWSAGHGVGSVADTPGAADLCARLIAEYRDAMQARMDDPFVPDAAHRACRRRVRNDRWQPCSGLWKQRWHRRVPVQPARAAQRAGRGSGAGICCSSRVRHRRALVKVIVISAAGRAFVAGGDLVLFGSSAGKRAAA
ncbi:hypothetical protein ACSBOB_28415 [Mesorhizobium sp. ASY16-5R]|uniref:hypothetical protein n=1 Tax=Mesorhizobium sp. ASY16-5R TaxID=3445772 RepID=UPI003F9FBC2C